MHAVCNITIYNNYVTFYPFGFYAIELCKTYSLTLFGDTPYLNKEHEIFRSFMPLKC